ncbi:DUF2628 domain-containing protein [Stenotrophomonas sp. TWI1151]|uniref:DUF2628 domain-containing protein n=1 Tax=Stenotrophomonas sp. TWI1151 TaxID=3136798 RepID=UPI00320876D2
MSTVPSPARPDETAEDPYRAPSTALHEAMIDAQIDAAVAVHDRHPLLAKAVGDNFALYARRWHLDDAGGRWPRPWHWPAVLFGFHWLMYRRMYLVALAVLVADFAIGMAMVLLDLAVGGVVLSLGVRLSLGIFGNALYRWHCRRMVARAQARFTGQPERINAELVRRGGTSRLALGLGLALFVVLRIFEGA